MYLFNYTFCWFCVTIPATELRWIGKGLAEQSDRRDEAPVPLMKLDCFASLEVVEWVYPDGLWLLSAGTAS